MVYHADTQFTTCFSRRILDDFLLRFIEFPVVDVTTKGLLTTPVSSSNRKQTRLDYLKGLFVSC
jgi:hypothetical protein